MKRILETVEFSDGALMIGDCVTFEGVSSFIVNNM